MFHSSLIITVFIFGYQESKNENTKLFSDIINSSNASILLDDIDFIYEGDFEIKKPTTKNSKTIDKDSNILRGDFSGHYIHRIKNKKTNGLYCNDVYIDLYMKNFESSIFTSHTTSATLNKQVSSINHVKGRSPLLTDIKKQSYKSLGNFRTYYSPELFFNNIFIPEVLQVGEKLSLSCELIGKEQILGRDTFVILRDPSIGSPKKSTKSNKITYKYWIDMNKSFSIVKYEKYIGNKLAERVDEIVLYNLGKQGSPNIWYPIKGKYYSFLEGLNGFSDVPQVVGELRVLPETIVINSHPDDSHFSVFYSSDSSKLSLLNRQFRYNLEIRKQDRTTSEGIQSNLNSQLAESNKQSAELDASQDAQSARDNFRYLIFGIVSIVIILVILVLWYRYHNA